MIKVRCAKCGKTINVPDQYAGKKGKCPGCQEMLTIPAAGAVAPAPARPKPPPPPPVEEVAEVEEAEAVEVDAEPEEVEEVAEAEPVEVVEADEEDRIAERPARPRSRRVADEDEDEDRVTQSPARKRRRPAEDDEDAPPRRRRRRNRARGEWADCPNCGASDAVRVHWTFWGGMIGPAVINTVRCNDCGTQYNGVRGDYNTTRIIIYFAVSVAIALVLVALGVVSQVGH